MTQQATEIYSPLQPIAPFARQHQIRSTSTRVAEGKVSCGDCLEILERIPANSVQCVFADPPFNLGKKYNSYKDKLPVETYFDWTEQWIKGAMRVLKEDGSLFIYNIPRMLIRTSQIAQDYAYFRHWISWNSPGRPLGKSLIPSHYGILYYTKSERGSKFFDVRAPHKSCRKCHEFLKDYGGKEHLRHPFGYLIGDVWDDIHRVRHSQKRIKGHPCQLPPHLIERLLLISTDPSDLVVDLFAGGGSAGVAAKNLGRRYIGCEKDAGYADMANEHIQRAQPQKQGDAFVSKHLGKLVSVRNVDLEILGEQDA